MTGPVARLSAFAHRHVWQRLPRDLRRGSLVQATALAAPRPDRDAVPVEPIIVTGFLTAASGLGASARLCYDALTRAGRRVLGIDLTRALGQASATVDFKFEDGSGHRGAGTLVLHVNAPFVPLALLRLGGALLRGKHLIGVWHWELPEAPPEWRAGVPFVHRVLVASTFTQAAIRRLAPGLHVASLPLPLTAPEGVGAAPPASGRPFAALAIFNMASGFSRKNPVAAIRAFAMAFPLPGEARLVVKMLNAGVFPEGAAKLRDLVRKTANVEIDERTLSTADLWRLYEASDVVLSLHRSEGFGLVAAEAQMAARPVIATDWSGTQDFVTPETGRPVPYQLIAARDPQGEYEMPGVLWADADVAAAAAHLMELRADPALAHAMGNRAAAEARRRFSPERYAANFCRLVGLV